MKKSPFQFIFAETNAVLLEHSITLSQLEQINWQQVSFLVLDATNLSAAYAALVQLRQQALPQVYLRPIVFVAAKGSREGWQWQAADAVIEKDTDHAIDWSVWSEQLEGINRWIDTLPVIAGAVDGHLPVRLLRLLASRQIDAAPLASADICTGFIYPLLQPLFTKQDMGAIQMLAFLEEQRLLSPTLFERAHFCPHCDSAFLNFKETCIECGSQDLDVVELVHHFKCAFTADISRFKRGGDSLVCPKCDKQLRHIGVDYDKPSVVNKCRVCQHVSQDANVMAKCFSCGCSTETKFLDLRRVNRYQLTSVGLNAAFYGLQTYFTNILEEELQLVSLREFELFVSIETARIARYGKSQSALAIVRLIGLDKIHFELGSKSKQVFSELAGIFKAVLRDTDVVTAYNESVFAILMTETSKDKADLALNRLNKAVERLFSENLDRTLDMQIQAVNVEAELQVKQTLEQFLNN
ncbi:diguanylate cyclase domain-containing protein [Rheinheimera maricola]|uniref:Diguanylate cyclase n=1 Tax=Rheinheimera maricola TaxID=2793282 RepID=A0ABS7XEX9_9GAMM|nr:diguanylate cyclase [Rheinheimera maricola]MBZ9613243.1 diguanylate cyclase [Rheinheimera maricola]